MIRFSSRPGSLILEGLVGFSLFGLFLGAATFALLLSNRSMISAGHKARSVFLTERALEATKSIRDEDFALLTNGDHGLEIRNGKWAFSGTSMTNSGFVTTVNISTLTTNLKQISATTTWNFGTQGSGRLTLNSELSNWRDTVSVGNWATASGVVNGAVQDSTSVVFRNLLVSGTAAYITGDAATAGDGLLWTYDVSARPPSRTDNVTFTGEGTGIAKRGDTLYVLTEATSGELRIYDVSNPDTPSFVRSEDLPGSARATSIEVYDQVLLVGMQLDATDPEFYAYYIPDQSKFVQSGSLQITDGGVNDIYPYSTYAYLATTTDTSEIRVAWLTDLENIASQASSGFNLSDRSEDGTAIAFAGTSACIGTQGGSLFSEFVLLSSTGAVPKVPPGWSHEVGSGGQPVAEVTDIAIDPSGKYAFLSSDSPRRLQVIDLHLLQGAGSEEVYSFSSGDFGRGVWYDPVNDLLYYISDTWLRIFSPT